MVMVGENHRGRLIVLSCCSSSGTEKIMNRITGPRNHSQDIWIVFFMHTSENVSSSGSGTVSTQPREDNWGATSRESSGSGLENRNYRRGDSLRWPRDTLCPLKLAPTSPTSCGRSVGIVRLRTKAAECWFFKIPPKMFKCLVQVTIIRKIWGFHANEDSYCHILGYSIMWYDTTLCQNPEDD
jgi:hypothetical protein